MADAKSIDTLMPINGNLDRDESDKDVDVKRNTGMIRYLLYLIAYMPNIMFSLYMGARYQSAHKKSHLKVIKRILDTFIVHLSMSFSFARIVIVVWLVTPILIFPITNRIEKVLVKFATCFQTS